MCCFATLPLVSKIFSIEVATIDKKSVFAERSVRCPEIDEITGNGFSAKFDRK